MKIAVYTTIFGEYDKLIRPEFKKEADFFLFTDTDIKTDDFIVYRFPQAKNPRRESRKYKINPHIYLPTYDYTIYLDGSISMMISPREAVEKYLNGFDIAVHLHPWRDCIYDEIRVCAKFNLVKKEVAERQLEFIKSKGYPEHNGLTENGVIIRRRSEAMKQLSQQWQVMYDRFTQRDQLSFCYVCWRLGIRYNIINNSLREMRGLIPTEFKLYNHVGSYNTDRGSRSTV